ncbi:hypothetical protein [Cellulosilyticum lentocellum]|uniref:Uncharacterized protein n=1 Tax=Cellulosilyticum lentocellum (strain ATCC 49066 / DSM 5427 / NCIMB 11756 / RHM5) TaxID=642492 RepID=F2JNX1_CELLD|nr:hypothetical protein [Cellulosilyticum lentocellum]ADZ82469.1 hypothetical protein Clole_0736 [Cellulosilyticum lentocellum DSM 5427]
MTNEQLEQANEIKKEIITLEAEVEQMIVHKESFILRQLRKVIDLPSKKTHYNLYCTNNLDCIGSTVVLREDEVEMLTNYKKQRIEQLSKQLESI